MSLFLLRVWYWVVESLVWNSQLGVQGGLLSVGGCKGIQLMDSASVG